MGDALVVNFKYVVETKLKNIEIFILSENTEGLKKHCKTTDIFGQKIDLTELELYFDLSGALVDHLCDPNNQNQEISEYTFEKENGIFIPISARIDTDVWLEYITKHTDSDISSEIKSRLLEEYAYEIQIGKVELLKTIQPFYLDVYNTDSNDFFQIENNTLHFEKKNVHLEIHVSGELQIGGFEDLGEHTPYHFFKTAHPSIFKQFFCFRNKPFVAGKHLFFTEAATQHPVFELKTMLKEKGIIQTIQSQAEIEEVTFGKTLKLSLLSPHAIS
ncbi:MAG: hypothetical protein HQM14_00595 [SAR324 cluster bacterium]|nr:hypothetical protein [SAR324 cluster bacterium]